LEGPGTKAGGPLRRQLALGVRVAFDDAGGG